MFCLLFRWNLGQNPSSGEEELRIQIFSDDHTNRWRYLFMPYTLRELKEWKEKLWIRTNKNLNKSVWSCMNYPMKLLCIKYNVFFFTKTHPLIINNILTAISFFYIKLKKKWWHIYYMMTLQFIFSNWPGITFLSHDHCDELIRMSWPLKWPFQIRKATCQFMTVTSTR